MQWDAILRDSVGPAAPYVVWVGLALATSIFVALIREPLCRVLREARGQIHSLQSRLVARSALSLGRRFHRFWLLRQHDSARTVAGALDRLAEALPHVGRRSIGRVVVLEGELRKQLVLLESLGLTRTAPLAAQQDRSPNGSPRGSWWKLLTLIGIAGLTGAANSFLLNEFFQGVITSDALFPSAFPDFHVSHVFAVLIFMMEVAIGFALHHFAEDQEDQSAARKLLAMAPWVVLVGLLWLEGWAYALLSHQIDIPQRLSLPAGSGLYSFARYFLALFGAGLTLLLASLGYLLGKEVERLQAGSQARRQERLLDSSGWAFHQRAEQIDRTERALARLQATLGAFQLDLVHRFKRALDLTSDSEELAATIRDAIGQTLDSARLVDGALGRRLDLLEVRDLRPIRTRAQALGEMGLFSGALVLLVGVSWASGQYIAAFIQDIHGHRESADLLATAGGVIMTGFGLSAGYVTAMAWRGGHSIQRRILRLLAFVVALLTGAALIGLAITNQSLGPLLPLNLLFGTVHAGGLILLGAVFDLSIVHTLHTLQLLALHLERCLMSLVAVGLRLARVVLAVTEWGIRVIAVFGQLVVRPRPAVRVGVAEVLRSPSTGFTDRSYASVSRSERA